jgi:hypothetical protein
LTQAQWAWERGRAPRGGQCAKDSATFFAKKGFSHTRWGYCSLIVLERNVWIHLTNVPWM